MSEAVLGYKHYMFIDGDLPGNGDDMSLPGHEAMMITNKNKTDRRLTPCHDPYQGKGLQTDGADDDGNVWSNP